MPRRKTWPRFGETLAPDLQSREGERGECVRRRYADVYAPAQTQRLVCIFFAYPRDGYSTQPNLGFTDIFTGSTAFAICMITRKRNSFPNGKRRRGGGGGDLSGLACLSFPRSPSSTLRPLWSSFGLCSPALDKRSFPLVTHPSLFPNSAPLHFSPFPFFVARCLSPPPQVVPSFGPSSLPVSTRAFPSHSHVTSVRPSASSSPFYLQLFLFRPFSNIAKRRASAEGSSNWMGLNDRKRKRAKERSDRGRRADHPCLGSRSSPFVCSAARECARSFVWGQ